MYFLMCFIACSITAVILQALHFLFLCYVQVIQSYINIYSYVIIFTFLWLLHIALIMTSYSVDLDFTGITFLWYCIWFCFTYTFILYSFLTSMLRSFLLFATHQYLHSLVGVCVMN